MSDILAYDDFELVLMETFTGLPLVRATTKLARLKHVHRAAPLERNHTCTDV